MAQSAPGNNAQSAPVSNPPWWRLPIVWLVIGGPALVVVAGLTTVVIAVRNVDPVLDTSAGQVHSAKELPAHKARNHAADPTRAVLDAN
ncbi:nitrogen fixation protein FixH [Aquabacterium sp. A3]|uniref:nitrogen fixation protein FixH n=1 Tax=Aquabacterium sp. A3 TaxID=3132829 RepID=UPI003119EE57